MSLVERDNEKTPFFVPFLVALLFGIPIAVVWYLVATELNLAAKLTTILLGSACGFGARVSARGFHPAGAAIIATVLLMVAIGSVILIRELAAEADQTFLSMVIHLASQGDFKAFADDWLRIMGTGRIFTGFGLGVLAAYWISDAS